MISKVLKVILLLTITLLMTGCHNSKVTKLSFRNGITWESRASDVVLAEGDFSKKLDDSNWLCYDDVPVSNHIADDLSYIFGAENDALITIRYRFFSLTPKNIDNLVDSLTDKYGKPSSPNTEYTAELMKLVGLDNSMFMSTDWYWCYNNWQLSDGTFIAAWEDKRYGYQILYFNGGVLSDLITKPNTSGL